jgi:hypothetical protein
MFTENSCSELYNQINGKQRIDNPPNNFEAEVFKADWIKCNLHWCYENVIKCKKDDEDIPPSFKFTISFDQAYFAY